MEEVSNIWSPKMSKNQSHSTLKVQLLDGF
jgi:hypothetical protein